MSARYGSCSSQSAAKTWRYAASVKSALVPMALARGDPEESCGYTVLAWSVWLVRRSGCWCSKMNDGGPCSCC